MSDPFLGPLARENRDDPYPCYRWLLAERPVYYDEREGYWAISRYADVVAAARNYKVFSSASGIGSGYRRSLTMIASDPPNHTRLRKLLTKAFQPAVIEGLTPRIIALCHELVDSALARGEFDLMQDFAIPLPMIVIAELLGFDPGRRVEFRRWSNALVGVFSNPESLEARREYAQTFPLFLSAVAAEVYERERQPRHDLISLLVAAREDGDELSPQEVASSSELFLAAGNETTSALIGNAALALARHPDTAVRIVSDPKLIPSLIEETIRYDDPVQATFRTTTEAVTLHGIAIPANAKVALLWAAANHDPTVFNAPERFMIERTPNPHLGFGHGIHHCLGAPLARLEARLAASVLMERFRWLEPQIAAATRDHSTALFRRLITLPMSFEIN